jgi:hypothetical protein
MYSRYRSFRQPGTRTPTLLRDPEIRANNKKGDPVNGLVIALSGLVAWTGGRQHGGHHMINRARPCGDAIATQHDNHPFITIHDLN